MMLDRDRLVNAQLGSVECREILRMKIVHNEQVVPINFIHRNQIEDGFLKCLECLVMLQVANVLADESLSTHNQRDCIFQVSTQCQNRPRAWQGGYCSGSIPTRSPQDGGSECASTGDRIIHAPGNGPLSDKKCIRNAG